MTGTAFRTADRDHPEKDLFNHVYVCYHGTPTVFSLNVEYQGHPPGSAPSCSVCGDVMAPLVYTNSGKHAVIDITGIIPR